MQQILSTKGAMKILSDLILCILLKKSPKFAKKFETDCLCGPTAPSQKMI